MQFIGWITAQKQKLIDAIAVATGTPANDADKLVATHPSTGKISSTLLDTSTAAGGVVVRGSDGKIADEAMPATVTFDVNPAIASEALAPGDAVEWWSDAGVAKVRLANATAGTERTAEGYVREAYAVGAPVKVYADGTNTNASGLTPGLPVYLSTTGGKATTTPPAAPHMLQWIGRAISATSYDYQIHVALVRSP